MSHSSNTYSYLIYAQTSLIVQVKLYKTAVSKPRTDGCSPSNNSCVNVYVCAMFIRVCFYMCIYECVCMYTYMYKHFVVCICGCMWYVVICICMCWYLCICTHMHVHKRVYMCLYMFVVYVCMYMYIYNHVAPSSIFFSTYEDLFTSFFLPIEFIRDTNYNTSKSET